MTLIWRTKGEEKKKETYNPGFLYWSQIKSDELRKHYNDFLLKQTRIMINPGSDKDKERGWGIHKTKSWNISYFIPDKLFSHSLDFLYHHVKLVLINNTSIISKPIQL